MRLRTCVHPSGRFVYGLHSPSYSVENLRENDFIIPLGATAHGGIIDNDINFPPGQVSAVNADPIFEIPNPFPFRGATYIGKPWADSTAERPESISLPTPDEVSFSRWLAENNIPDQMREKYLQSLPRQLRLTLAATSTDPDDLQELAKSCCEFTYNSRTDDPVGLVYQKKPSGNMSPVINDHELFEALANNYHLPDILKEIMVLRPGAQGGSEIVGEWLDRDSGSHVFEYLRRNSYIPWGHYASNMAHDAIRYRIRDLSESDMLGLRRLYYQRSFVRLARMLKLPFEPDRRTLTDDELDGLRSQIIVKLHAGVTPEFTATLWGWNFGFDYAPSGYRLHASHQQIHQQFALLPASVAVGGNKDKSNPETIPSYGCGDLVADFCDSYQKETGKDFFDCYLSAITNNTRMDGRADKDKSLVVLEDDNILLFVPKAQVSKWELQIMCKKQVGNILEADTPTRRSIDRALLAAQSVLEAIGARMVTSIELPKRFDAAVSGQRLLYSLLPKLPESMGAFSEAQLRWIMGHYPEDFASFCRSKLQRGEV